MTPASFVNGVDLVSVPTEDLDRAAEFYENVVGLEPGPRWQRPGQPAMGVEFETGGVTIAIIHCEVFGIEFSPHRVPIALHVDDVAAARAELESRGVSFMGRQRRLPSGALPGSRRQRAGSASPVRAEGLNERARLKIRGAPLVTADRKLAAAVDCSVLVT